MNLPRVKSRRSRLRAGSLLFRIGERIAGNSALRFAALESDAGMAGSQGIDIPPVKLAPKFTHRISTMSVSAYSSASYAPVVDIWISLFTLSGR